MIDAERPDDPSEGEERTGPEGVEPAAEGAEARPEPAEASGDDTEDVPRSVEVWEPERPESAVPDQAPEPLPPEDPEDVAASEAPASPS